MRVQAEPTLKFDLSAIVDLAQSEPIFVDRDEREVAVVLSSRDYENLRRSAVDELLRLCDGISDRAAERGMTDEIFEQLLADA